LLEPYTKIHRLNLVNCSTGSIPLKNIWFDSLPPANHPRKAVSLLLLFLIRQAWRNAQKAADDKEMLATVIAFEVADSDVAGGLRKGDLRFEFVNDATILPEDMIPPTRDRPSVPFKKRLPLLYGDSRGRGLELMRRVARLLHPHVDDRSSLRLENVMSSDYHPQVKVSFWLAKEYFEIRDAGTSDCPIKVLSQAPQTEFMS